MAISKSACRTREFAHNGCLIKRGEQGLSRAFFASANRYGAMNSLSRNTRKPAEKTHVAKCENQHFTQ
jgi:hypothetical protein